MGHILLLILKIVGFVLLGIIGLILLLLLLVLLVPVRYKGETSKHGELRAKGVISWLLHIVHVSVEYKDGKPVYVVRLFGIAVKGNALKKKKKRKKKKTGKAKARQNETEEQCDEQADRQNGQSENVTQGLTDCSAGPETADSSNTDRKKQETDASNTDRSTQSICENGEMLEENSDKAEKRQNREQLNIEAQKEAQAKKKAEKEDKEKAGKEAKKKARKEAKKKARKEAKAKRRAKKEAKAKAKGTKSSESFKDKLKGIAQNLKNRYNKFKSIIETLQDERVHRAVRLIKASLGKLLRHIRPRRLKGNLHFGFSDPATTGYVLGGLAFFYGLYGRNFSIVPDFENSIIEGDISFRGRIVIGRLLYIALRVWFNRDFKFLKSKLKDDALVAEALSTE